MTNTGLTITQGDLPATWDEAFDNAVNYLKHGRFTSEDVVNMVGLPVGETGLHRNNAVGARMVGLSKRKVIRKTGRRVKSVNKSSHANEIAEWTSYGNEILTDDWAAENTEKLVQQRDVALALYKKAKEEVLAIHYEAGKSTTSLTRSQTYCYQCKTVFPCRTRRVFM